MLELVSARWGWFALAFRKLRHYPLYFPPFELGRVYAKILAGEKPSVELYTSLVAVGWQLISRDGIIFGGDSFAKASRRCYGLTLT